MDTYTMTFTEKELNLLSTALQSHKDYVEKFALDFMDSDDKETLKNAEDLRKEFFESTLLWQKTIRAVKNA